MVIGAFYHHLEEIAAIKRHAVEAKKKSAERIDGIAPASVPITT